MHLLYLPRLGQTMTHGTVTAWRVEPDVEFDPGEILYDLETDKSVTEVEAKMPGRIVRVTAKEGEHLPVGTVLAAVADPGENPSPEDIAAELGEADAKADGEATLSAASAQPALLQRGSGSMDQPSSESERHGHAGVRAVPKVRKMAARLGIDLREVQGSGPHGRVLAKDIEAVTAGNSQAVPGGQPQDLAPPPEEAAATPATERVTPDQQAHPTEPPFEPEAATPPVREDGAMSGLVSAQTGGAAARVRERRRLTGVAKAMAVNLAQAWPQTPQFTQQISVDASALQRQRRIDLPQGLRATVNDLVILSLAQAVARVPEVNASYEDGDHVLYSDVNVAVAIDAPRGLVVPVIRAVQDLSLGEISLRARDLADRAKVGALAPQNFEGATITVSNLGRTGVETGVPVVNPGSAATVFVGALKEKPLADDGEVVVRPVLGLAVAYDHRMIDGAMAARFTNALREALEH